MDKAAMDKKETQLQNRQKQSLPREKWGLMQQNGAEMYRITENGK